VSVKSGEGHSYKYSLKSNEWTIFKSEESGHYLALSVSLVRTLHGLPFFSLLYWGITHRDIDLQRYRTELPWHASPLNRASSRLIRKI